MFGSGAGMLWTSARRLAPLSIVIAAAESAIFDDAADVYPVALSIRRTSITPVFLIVIEELALSCSVPVGGPPAER